MNSYGKKLFGIDFSTVIKSLTSLFFNNSGKIKKGTACLILIIIGTATLLPSLGIESHIGSRETRHAQIAKEMYFEKNYLIPHLNRRPYYLKPPFYHWLVVASYKIFDKINLFSARFPSAIFAILGCIGIFFLGELLFEEMTGFIAAIGLLSTLLYIEWAMMCRMDMVMSVLLLYSTVFSVLSAKAKRYILTFLYWIIAYILVFFAAFSKGTPPLGIGILLTSIAWLMLAKKNRKIFPILLLIGIITLSIPIYVWLSKMKSAGVLNAFLNYQLGKTRPVHPGPFYFYLFMIPVWFLPHILWIPGGLKYNILTKKKVNWLPIILFSVGLLVFSIAKNKQIHFLLPILPFSILIMGKYLTDYIKGEIAEGNNKLIKFPCIIWFIIAIPLSFFVIFGERGEFRIGFIFILLAILIVIVISILGTKYVTGDKPKKSILLIGIQICFILVVLHNLVAYFYWKPSHSIVIAKKIISHIDPSINVAIAPTKRDIIAFNLPTIPYSFDYPEEAIKLIPKFKRLYLIVPKRFLPPIFKAFHRKIEKLGTWTFDNKNQVFLLYIGNRL